MSVYEFCSKNKMSVYELDRINVPWEWMYVLIYIRMVIKEVLTIEYSKPDYVILASLKIIIVFLIHTYFIE
jgi:hypothetical protein